VPVIYHGKLLTICPPYTYRIVGKNSPCA